MPIFFLNCLLLATARLWTIPTVSMTQFGISMILPYNFAYLQEFILHLSHEIKRFHKFAGSAVFLKEGLSLDLPLLLRYLF